jgi:DNA-binding LacI/PurR family transcriptional regulator
MAYITIREIAQATGYSATTVSKALRGRGKLSEETCRRVKEVAEELGYRPHPGVNALMKRMRENKVSERQWTAIAYLHDWPHLEALQKSSFHPEYLLGAQQRCEELGFQLELYGYSEQEDPVVKLPRLSRVLQMIHAKGIRGVVIAPRCFEFLPFPTDSTIWEPFSVAALLQIGRERSFHCCCPDYFHNIQLLYDKLWQSGKRRIGLYMLEHMYLRTRGELLGGYFNMQWQLNPATRIQPLVESQWTQQSFSQWLKENSLDAVIAQDHRVLKWIRDMGYAVPEDIAFGMFSVAPGATVGGIVNDPVKLGSLTVDLLYAQMQQGVRGLSGSPMVHQMQGSFVAGKTI